MALIAVQAFVSPKELVAGIVMGELLFASLWPGRPLVIATSVDHVEGLANVVVVAFPAKLFFSYRLGVVKAFLVFSSLGYVCVTLEAFVVRYALSNDVTFGAVSQPFELLMGFG